MLIKSLHNANLISHKSRKIQMITILLIFSQDGTEICRGRLDDFGTILSPAFRAATVFVGISVIISIICIISFVLFFMCRYHCIATINTSPLSVIHKYFSPLLVSVDILLGFAEKYDLLLTPA